MSVTNMSTFKIAKLTAQILDTVKREGTASLKEFGELPFQFGLASEVLMSSDCPEDVALVLKGRTVARYVELIQVSAVASPETVSAASKVSAAKDDSGIPPSLGADVSLSYLAIPVTDEMDAEGLLDYVNEMIGALREKMGGEGYSVEEREALVGVHKELDHTESEVHVFIDTDILGEDVYAKIVEEYFDAEGYEVFDAAEYEEKHQLPALLASLPEDVLLELAGQLDVTAKKGKKLTPVFATTEILKLDKDDVIAAIDNLVNGGGSGSEEQGETDVAEIVNELSLKQLRSVADHLEIKISKTAKSPELVDAIMEEDESDITDALDALGLMPESEEEGGEPGDGETDMKATLELLDSAQLKSVAKALEISHTKKTTDAELVEMLMEAEEDELHEALTDLGLLDGDAEDGKPKGDVSLADALEECELPELKAVAKALELKAPVGKKATKEAFIELLTSDDVDETDVLAELLELELVKQKEEESGDDDEERMAELKEQLEGLETDALQAVAEDLEVKVVGKSTTVKLIKAILDCDLDDVAAAIEANSEEEEEEGDSLESLYSLLADCKASRGNAAERKELLASLEDTDLVEAKRKDVVTLQKIAALSEMDDDTNEMIALLAGDETPLSETVLGYFTKVFAAEIKEAIGEEEEQEEAATPAKTGRTAGKVNRTAGGKK